MALFDSLVKPALDSVTALIGQFHMSPEQQAQAQQAITDAAQKAQAAAEDYDVQLNTVAGQNIRAEEQSGDKFTERARPSFAYVIIAVVAFDYIFLPFAQIFGSKIPPIVLPPELLTFFGIYLTGYSFQRTAEKVAAMPGDSQISALGIKIGNKS